MVSAYLTLPPPARASLRINPTAFRDGRVGEHDYLRGGGDHSPSIARVNVSKNVTIATAPVSHSNHSKGTASTIARVRRGTPTHTRNAPTKASVEIRHVTARRSKSVQGFRLNV